MLYETGFSPQGTEEDCQQNILGRAGLYHPEGLGLL